MEYPRFYIYAPRPLDNFEKYFQIPEEQEELINILRARGFDFSINGVEPCKVENLMDMQGLILYKINGGISLSTIDCNQDLYDLKFDEILLVQTYAAYLDAETLDNIHKVFSWIFGFTTEPRITRSMNPIYWTPQPRVYVVATSSVDYDKNFC